MKEPFKLIFITQDDPFYVRCFFEEFLSIYPDLAEIQSVIIQKPMGKKSSRVLMQQMYEFYGPIDFFKMGLRFARVKGLSKLSHFYPSSNWLTLKQLCQAHNICVIHQMGIHQPEFLNTLRQQNLDLIVSVAAPTIFKEELINIPRLGCINIHHAPLPRYRGMMPNFWQLYHGEKKVGVTIHKINPKIDEGEIILQREIAVTPGESLDELIKRTKRLGAHYMAEAIGMMKNGSVRLKENHPEEGSYFSFPTKEDVRKFKEMGYKLL